jgi:hypothetical protein
MNDEDLEGGGSGVIEELFRHLPEGAGEYAVYSGRYSSTFRRNVLLSSSRSKSRLIKQQASMLAWLTLRN